MFYARFQGGTLDNLFTTGNGIYQQSMTLTGCPTGQTNCTSSAVSQGAADRWRQTEFNDEPITA